MRNCYRVKVKVKDMNDKKSISFTLFDLVNSLILVSYLIKVKGEQKNEKKHKYENL